LSNNKILISTTFATLIQTLEIAPEIVKLIHNIPSAKDGEQYKDNDNYNVIKYLEGNKGRILYLAEKDYECLVEMLTNNAIDIATAPSSSSTSTLKLPSHSSLTFKSI
jgi:hypothetical protein